jgi:N4-(beta-N-acetylglucosaminyl)-L-asparaginase
MSLRNCAVSVWHKGLPINEVAARVLQEGRDCLDAVEEALKTSEDDLNDGSTGWGGFPNFDGEVELDAAIMYGPGARAGAVGALRRTHYAISVARRVMELTPHLLLVGDGAVQFARAQGFPEFDLLTDIARTRWQEFKAKTGTLAEYLASFRQLHSYSAKPAPKPWDMQREEKESHDTMSTIALDAAGNLAAGCTTSGLAFKLPGRVGDSPIIGAGLYVDQEIGAAVGTGVGEEAMRVCAACLVVEYMRQGHDPSAACAQALRRLQKANPDLGTKQLGFAALTIDGLAGGAALQPGFGYCYFNGEENQYFPVEPVG